jgi:hypothetical protein
MAGQLNESSNPAGAKSAVTPFHRHSSFQPLTHQDLCDCSALEGDHSGVHMGSCGAQARVRVTLMTGSQIVFCGHHYAQHGPKITQAAAVYDERELVDSELSSASIAPWNPLVPAE